MLMLLSLPFRFPNARRARIAEWGIECDKPLNGSEAVVVAKEQQQTEVAVQGTCDGKAEATCIAPSCVWCTSAAVGGGCYTPVRTGFTRRLGFYPRGAVRAHTRPQAPAGGTDESMQGPQELAGLVTAEDAPTLAPAHTALTPMYPHVAAATGRGEAASQGNL